jgi:hypothetical protein
VLVLVIVFVLGCSLVPKDRGLCKRSGTRQIELERELVVELGRSRHDFVLALPLLSRPLMFRRP